jgi:hypothetical protein
MQSETKKRKLYCAAGRASARVRDGRPAACGSNAGWRQDGLHVGFYYFLKKRGHVTLPAHVIFFKKKEAT